MHELKFRFWDEVNKRFWYGGQEGESISKETFQTYFKDGALKAVMYQPVSYGFKDVDDYEERELKKSQYTGLKDRNGREIYEGNIYLFDGSTGDPGVRAYGLPSKRLTGELFIVAKLDCGFVLRHISSYGHSGFDTPNCIIKGWPIIDNYTLWNHQRSLVYKGNIYENPELLEVENG